MEAHAVLCEVRTDSRVCVYTADLIQIRSLVERFDSKLADVGNPLVRQLGRYLRWPSVDPGLLRCTKEDQDRQTGRGYLPKSGHVNILNRAQLALFDYPKFFSPRAFFPQLQGKCQGITRKDGARPTFFPGKEAKFHRES
jgi:hypothetical protein